MLNYAEMIEAAEKSGLRQVLGQIGQEVASMFEAVAQRSKPLASLPRNGEGSWDGIDARWRIAE